jgi:hypothetical protein
MSTLKVVATPTGFGVKVLPLFGDARIEADGFATAEAARSHIAATLAGTYHA